MQLETSDFTPPPIHGSAMRLVLGAFLNTPTHLIIIELGTRRAKERERGAEVLVTLGIHIGGSSCESPQSVLPPRVYQVYG